jgi:hypothetical protein
VLASEEVKLQGFIDTQATHHLLTISRDEPIPLNHSLRNCPVELEVWLAVAQQEIQYGRPEQAISIIGQLFLRFDKRAGAEVVLPHGLEAP